MLPSLARTFINEPLSLAGTEFNRLLFLSNLKLAPEEGLEPPTYWLTASYSTIELLRNGSQCRIRTYSVDVNSVVPLPIGPIGNVLRSEKRGIEPTLPKDEKHDFVFHYEESNPIFAPASHKGWRPAQDFSYLPNF